MYRKILFMITMTLFFYPLTFCKKEIVKEENKQQINVQQTTNTNNSKYDNFFIECSPESKKADYCIEVYEPVCGWFTKKPSECQNLYCKESYANHCFACKDKRVFGYTKGKCEK